MLASVFLAPQGKSCCSEHVSAAGCCGFLTDTADPRPCPARGATRAQPSKCQPRHLVTGPLLVCSHRNCHLILARGARLLLSASAASGLVLYPALSCQA